MFRGIGVWEVLIVLAIILVLFGATRLPKMAHSLGHSLTSFKKGLRETADDVKEAISEDVSDTEVVAEAKTDSSDNADKDDTPK